MDFNNDGWLDIFALNGAVLVVEALERVNDRYPLHQPNQLYLNEGGKRFKDISKTAGPDISISEVSRGAAFGDMDNDGDTDILVINNNGPVRLLENRKGNRNKWLGLRLVDGTYHRDLLGARAGLVREGKPVLWRRVHTDGSYCSTNDPRVLFGLGETDNVKSIEIVWPDGTRETWPNPKPMTYTTLIKGSVK